MYKLLYAICRFLGQAITYNNDILYMIDVD